MLKDQYTIRCEDALLAALLESGKVVDERLQKPFKRIIKMISTGLSFGTKEKVRVLPPLVVASAVMVPQLKERFAMTLSHFDVSAKSQDPVILIPIAALRAMPSFWNFLSLYTDSGAGYPQLYAIANIRPYAGTVQEQYIRIYYYCKKSEFRLQCMAIKRGGRGGDIISIKKIHAIP